MSWSEERADPSDASLVAAGQQHLDDDAAVVERVAVERAALSWADRLSSSGDGQVSVAGHGGARFSGRCLEVGTDWCAVQMGERLAVVRLDQVLTVTLPPATGPGPGRVTRGMGSPLRRWAARPSEVAVHLVDGSVHHGRIVDVLSDAVTVAAGRSVAATTVPWTSLVAVVGEPLGVPD